MNNKNLLWAVAIVAVIAILVGWKWGSEFNKIPQILQISQPVKPTPTPTPTPSEQPTPTPTPTAQSGSAPKVKLNYGDAIKEYQFRIQFVECHGNPGSVSIRAGVPLMLDNRDNKTHTLKVAGKTYTVKAYDYALSYIQQQGSYNLTCDGGGAATVNVYK